MRFLDYLFIAAFGALAFSSPTETGEKLLQQTGPAILKLTAPFEHDSGGTGFLLKERGGIVVVTNGHVCGIASGGQMLAWNADGSSFLVKIRKISETTDLCLLDPVRKELAPNTPALQLAETQHRAGKLWVVGHPKLQDNTVSSGYIVSFGEISVIESERTPADCTGPTRSWKLIFCVRSIYAYDTSIVIYPGNSGSPVMTAGGYVVGVMFAGSQDTHFGAFIPLSDLKDFLAAAP